MTPKNDVIIRKMQAKDLERAAELERECFSDPWSTAMLEEELFNPLCAMFVAECGGKVLGYAGMHAIVGEGYITNVAVDPAARRQGIGRALMQRFIAGAEEWALEFITLEVRASNTPAIALYESLGFRTAGLRAAYYKNPTEDALLMTLSFEKGTNS